MYDILSLTRGRH